MKGAGLISDLVELKSESKSLFPTTREAHDVIWNPNLYCIYLRNIAGAIEHHAIDIMENLHTL